MVVKRASKPARKLTRRKPDPNAPPMALKRRPGKTKLALAPDMPFEVARGKIISAAKLITDEIIYEIEFEVVAAGKSVSADAFQEFGPKLLGAVTAKVFHNGNWGTDAPNVLAAAKLMAGIAVALAGASNVVSKAHMHPAFFAVQSGSNVCTLSAGGGAWCDFFI